MRERKREIERERESRERAITYFHDRRVLVQAINSPPPSCRGSASPNSPPCRDSAPTATPNGPPPSCRGSFGDKLLKSLDLILQNCDAIDWYRLYVCMEPIQPCSINLLHSCISVRNPCSHPVSTFRMCACMYKKQCSRSWNAILGYCSLCKNCFSSPANKPRVCTLEGAQKSRWWLKPNKHLCCSKLWRAGMCCMPGRSELL